MKAVIYARYSSDNQREESIEGQLRECTAFAEKNSVTVLRHYIDRAFSAKTDNRPEFQNMIKDSGKKLFDMIIVWKLDRFSRNRYDSARYKAMLKKNGVKVVFGYGSHFRRRGGHHSGIGVGRLRRILLCRPVRKGHSRHDGECAEVQVQRRQKTNGLCDRRGSVFPD